MQDVITTAGALEARVGKASALVQMKVVDHLDEGALGWVRRSPIMFASVGDGRKLDVTLGGDRPGWADGDQRFLHLRASSLDDALLARPGAGFGSVFLLPSVNEMLRVDGVVVDVNGDVVRVEVTECYFHCGKALIRSDFWSAKRVDASPADLQGFVGKSRFMALGTVDAEGRADCSPKGDPAGAMGRVSPSALLFADRPGNRRIDSFRNMVSQPRVAAALLIPGAPRVSVFTGVASISEAEDVRAAFIVQDKTPALVTEISELRAELRDSPALARAAIWPAPPAPDGVDPAKIALGHLKHNKSLAAKAAATLMSVPGLLQKGLEADYKKNLY